MSNNQKTIIFNELLKIFKKIYYLLNNLEKIVREKEAKILEKRKEFFNKVKIQMPVFKKDFKEAAIMGIFIWCAYFILVGFYAVEIAPWAEALPPFDPEKIPGMKWWPAK